MLTPMSSFVHLIGRHSTSIGPHLSPPRRAYIHTSKQTVTPPLLFGKDKIVYNIRPTYMSSTHSAKLETGRIGGAKIVIFAMPVVSQIGINMFSSMYLRKHQHREFPRTSVDVRIFRAWKHKEAEESYPPYLEAVSSIRNLRTCHAVYPIVRLFSNINGRFAMRLPDIRRLKLEKSLKTQPDNEPTIPERSLGAQLNLETLESDSNSPERCDASILYVTHVIAVDDYAVGWRTLKMHPPEKLYVKRKPKLYFEIEHG
ncbi:hypothetical protein ANN_18390 [Periplaneta americana]|uniref:Uncharacterized protein n=1 Tax=Periplaneta americana TaxID=6978 RepID=A0ABQ8SPV5_PERAM|nr:hypothetical protein ANN_18390 [Periplaneta americana]